MLIIVGLGNPGLKYKKTYHNMGYTTVDKLAERLGVSFKKNLCDAKVAETFVKGEKVLIAKPLTYMNNSGISVKQLIASNKARPEDVIVVYDDIDLECGALRIRKEGSGGTHNGMRSVVAECGNAIPRIRVGIGKSKDIPLVDFVLSNVGGENKEILKTATQKAADALYDYINERDLEKIGAKYNGK